MILAVAGSAIAGLWLLLVLLCYAPRAATASSSSFSTSSSSSDAPEVLNAGGYGFLERIFVDTVGSPGREVLSALIAVSLFMTGVALFAVTARIVFAMARDGALPLSKYLRLLHPATDSPVAATAFVAVCLVFLLSIAFGSIPAYNAIAYPSVSCLQVRRIQVFLPMLTEADCCIPRSLLTLFLSSCE